MLVPLPLDRLRRIRPAHLRVARQLGLTLAGHIGFVAVGWVIALPLGLARAGLSALTLEWQPPDARQGPTRHTLGRMRVNRRLSTQGSEP
jgi:hypothetical protein